MNITELTLVQTHLNALMRKPLTALTREADMLSMTFGAGEVTLRLQCHYRLTEQGRILLARNDAYQPSEAMWELWRSMGYEEDQIPEDYRCDAPGANRLDSCLEQLNADLEGLTVQSVLVNQLGDLTLVFASSATMTIQTDTCGGEECWRLMYVDGRDDLVVYGDGVELQRPGETE